jgi:hypothetical protein
VIEEGHEWSAIDSYLTFKEITAPSVIPPGYLRVYAKDKNGTSAFYLKDDAGSEREISPADTVTGTGTTNRLAYWTSSSVIGAVGALIQNRLLTADATGLPVSHSALTEGQVLFASPNGLPIGDSNLFWNNTSKYLQLPLKFGASGAHPYQWGIRVNTFLTLQIQDAGESPRFEFYAKDGDGTDSMSFTLFAKGTPTDLANFEQIRLEYDAADSTFKLLTNAGGSGTVRALHIFTGSNNNQLVLNTDGTIGMSGSLLSVGGGIALRDGMSAPATLAGFAILFVDDSDGDLKIKFGDGTVKLIVTDT